MENEALLLANELIQFIDRKKLRKVFLTEQKERGADIPETKEVMEYIENEYC